MNRRPEHWEDSAPNEPEPSRFLRETPPLFWWVAGLLTVMTVLAVASLVFYV